MNNPTTVIDRYEGLIMMTAAFAISISIYIGMVY